MISPLAYVSKDAKLGENVTVHPFAHIDGNVEIGDNCEIFPYASIVSGSRMGNNVKVYQGAIVGADPQDFRWKGEDTFCYIGNNVVIREHVIINRGIKHEGGTRIGDESFIMANSHIGHDNVLDGRTVIGNGVQLAGDSHVEECVILSSNVILHSGSNVGAWAMVKGGCRIAGNVPPFVVMAHNPVTYYGVNAYVMRSRGFGEDKIDDIAKAYRHVYQCDTSIDNAVRRIEKYINPSPERDRIIEFIRKNNMNLIATKTILSED